MAMSDVEMTGMSSSEKKIYLKKIERTRHLKIWHDNSGIANHGHILFCVSLLYDSKVFYTSEEYYMRYKKKVNIQQKVETPDVHLIGRCKSNDEQLAYITTRQDCLRELKKGFTINEVSTVEINDIMRIFSGDGPAAAMEVGNQKGGTYFCTSCGVNKSMADVICHCYQQEHI